MTNRVLVYLAAVALVFSVAFHLSGGVASAGGTPAHFLSGGEIAVPVSLESATTTTAQEFSSRKPEAAETAHTREPDPPRFFFSHAFSYAS